MGEEEEIPEESYGAMDFGLTMEEYEPESYVPSAPRVSHTPIVSSLSKSLSNLPARRMSTFLFSEEDGQDTPQSKSPVPMPGSAALDEDEGVFLLDDEDGDDEEEEIPEESYGAMDFGLTMEEYEPESYVPSAPRVSHTPIVSSLSSYMSWACVAKEGF